MKLLLGTHELALQNLAKKTTAIDYLTIEIELVLPTFKSWTADRII